MLRAVFQGAGTPSEAGSLVVPSSGRSKSSGSGKTIVEAWLELMSCSAWRWVDSLML